MQTRVVRAMVTRADTGRVVVPVAMQTDTGCRAGGDAGRHVPVVMQADTGCRAGGDAGRHGFSCQ